MNDPQCIELLEQAKQSQACDNRIGPYLKKAAENQLQLSDILPDDAVWFLAAVKKSAYRDILKQIARNRSSRLLVRNANFKPGE